MMDFKFFENREEELGNGLLMDNEHVIHYWNDGDERELLTARVIAWRTSYYMDNPQWRLVRFDGTMQQFFENRFLEIPVIRSIECDRILHYRSLDEVNVPIYRNFEGNVRYTIFYYELV